MSIDTATAYFKQAQTLIAQGLAELAPSTPAAWYQAISDRVTRPKPPAPVLGPAGFAFTDPVFGSKLLRVTDGAGTNTSWRMPSASALAAWNADSTKFFVVGPAGIRLYAFDPVTMKATQLPAAPTSQIEPQFSRVDPDRLYVIRGPVTRTLQAYSVSKNAYTDVLDFDTLGLSLDTPRTYIGGVFTSAAPETIAVHFGGQSQDAHYLVLWQQGTVRKILNTVVSTINGLATKLPLGFRLHSTCLDLSGRYVLLFPVNAQSWQVVVWDTTTDTLTAMTVNPGGHGAVGYGVYVNQDQGQAGLPYDAAQWQLRSLATPNTSTDEVAPVLTPKEVYWADHATWNHAKPDVVHPFISSTYRYGLGWDQTTYPWRAWDDEILAIDPVTKTVNRFCHHRSDLRDESNPLSWYFWYEPIANVSPDGKWCLFTSNWEKSLGPDTQDSYKALDGSTRQRSRQDVFLVALH